MKTPTSGPGLFFAVKLDSRLREAFVLAKPTERKYLDDPNFLQTIEVNGDKWVGKVVGSGPSLVEAEDIGRNVTSILHRVAPAVRVATTAVKILVLPEAVAAVVVPPVTEEEEDGPFIVDL